VGAIFSAPVQTGPGPHPASCTMGTGSFPGVKSGRGVTLTPHPLPVPCLWKSRAIPLLPLWAVRPVRSLYKGALYPFFLLKFFKQFYPFGHLNMVPQPWNMLFKNSIHGLTKYSVPIKYGPVQFGMFHVLYIN